MYLGCGLLHNDNWIGSCNKIDNINGSTMRYSNPAQLAQLELGHNAIDTSVLMGAHNRYIRLPPANSMQYKYKYKWKYKYDSK